MYGVPEGPSLLTMCDVVDDLRSYFIRESHSDCLQRGVYTPVSDRVVDIAICVDGGDWSSSRRPRTLVKSPERVEGVDQKRELICACKWERCDWLGADEVLSPLRSLSRPHRCPRSLSHILPLPRISSPKFLC